MLSFYNYIKNKYVPIRKKLFIKNKLVLCLFKHFKKSIDLLLINKINSIWSI